MNKRLLSVSLLFPILLLEAGHSLAHSGSTANQGLVFSRSRPRTSQVKLDRQESPPFFLAARKEKPKTCRWAGYCDDEDNQDNATSAIAWRDGMSFNDNSIRTIMTHGTRSTEIL
ncbi:hypothetical protein [Coleofasciculus sp. F4-SAH-05]|uniref:hypothetical protein n=1 Tax=Coleofasciculus sp. F4-SAH-05 TaxID=3069525 RepID=UPI0032FB5037